MLTPNGATSSLLLLAALVLAGPHVNAAPNGPNCQSLFRSIEGQSEYTWTELSRSIDTSLTAWFANVGNSRGSYNANSEHGRALEQIFEYQIGVTTQRQTAFGTLRKYNEKLAALVADGRVSRADTLIPAFVFVDLDGHAVWLAQGQPIPEGAKLYDGILRNETYARMVAAGYFPMGTAALTPTGIPGFQHDLAHLTSFLAHPDYMAAIRKTSTLVARGFASGQTISTNRLARLYFLNEGLSVATLRGRAKLLADLLMSPEMKRRSSSLGLDEMIAYLSSIPHDERQTARIKLWKNYDGEQYFVKLGGAARDPMSRNTYVLHDPIRMLFRHVANLDGNAPLDSVENFAKVQLLLLRLSEVNLQDWFSQETSENRLQSPAVRRLFDDSRLWSDEPDFAEAFLNI